jgi:flagellar motility protein MotE (MotC chaperone)
MTDIRRDLMEAGLNHYETFIRRHYHLIVDMETNTLYELWKVFAERAKYTTWNEQSYNFHIKQWTGGAKQKRIGKARPYVHNILPEKLKDLQKRDEEKLKELQKRDEEKLKDLQKRDEEKLKDLQKRDEEKVSIVSRINDPNGDDYIDE